MNAGSRIEQISLRPYRRDDADVLCAAVRESLAELQPWMPWAHQQYAIHETRVWLDHLATGKACHLATPDIARANLEATLAIEQAAHTGQPVYLPLRR